MSQSTSQPAIQAADVAIADIPFNANNVIQGARKDGTQRQRSDKRKGECYTNIIREIERCAEDLGSNFDDIRDTMLNSMGSKRKEKNYSTYNARISLAFKLCTEKCPASYDNLNPRDRFTKIIQNINTDPVFSFTPEEIASTITQLEDARIKGKESGPGLKELKEGAAAERICKRMEAYKAELAKLAEHSADMYNIDTWTIIVCNRSTVQHDGFILSTNPSLATFITKFKPDINREARYRQTARLMASYPAAETSGDKTSTVGTEHSISLPASGSNGPKPKKRDAIVVLLKNCIVKSKEVTKALDIDDDSGKLDRRIPWSAFHAWCHSHRIVWTGVELTMEWDMVKKAKPPHANVVETALMNGSLRFHYVPVDDVEEVLVATGEANASTRFSPEALRERLESLHEVASRTYFTSRYGEPLKRRFAKYLSPVSSPNDSREVHHGEVEGEA